MFSRRSDLPLDRDEQSRFLSWLIAFMVFLAVLAMAGLLVLNSIAGRWDQGVRGTLTVQIAPANDPVKDDVRLRAAVAVLASTPEVERYEAMSETRLLRLLEPWLGTLVEAGDLPLPQLIDVELKPESTIDLAVLTQQLLAKVPGASIDDHGIWLERLVRLIVTVEGVATAILAFIGFATVGTVVFTTRTGLAIHKEAIEVLHLIGAQDSYIARQFAGRALSLGLRGGLMGLVLAVPTVFGIGYLAGRMENMLIPEFALLPIYWAALAALPVAVALLAMLTARFTVMRTLGRML